MRDKFLFLLGSMSHLRPDDVDNLRIGDFLGLVDAIERQLAEMKGQG